MRKMNEVSERVIMDEVKWLFGDEMIMKLMFQTQHVEKKNKTQWPSVATCWLQSHEFLPALNTGSLCLLQSKWE